MGNRSIVFIIFPSIQLFPHPFNGWLNQWASISSVILVGEFLFFCEALIDLLPGNVNNLLAFLFETI